MTVCTVSPPFQRLNQLTHFHENWYELSDIRDHHHVTLRYQRGGKGRLWAGTIPQPYNSV
jgi:hypothetical protein